MGQQQEKRQTITEGGRAHAHPGVLQPAAFRGNAVTADGNVRALQETDQEQREQGQNGQHDGLDLGQLDLAAELRGEDLGGHHPVTAAKNVGRRKRAERGHESEQRGAQERRPQLGQNHLEEGAGSAGTEGGRRFEQGAVEAGQSGPYKKVEVHVHRIGVHQQDGGGALELPGRRFKAQGEHQESGQKTAFPEEEEEGDHPDERWQGNRQRHQGAEHAAAGKFESLENKSKRHSDEAGEKHRKHGQEEAAPQGLPLFGPGEEGLPEGQGAAAVLAAQTAEQGEEQRVTDQPEQEKGQQGSRPV